MVLPDVPLFRGLTADEGEAAVTALRMRRRAFAKGEILLEAGQRAPALGVVLACFGRYLASFVSGWVFYGSYASYYGFVSPVVYSICYNGAYMLPECIICVLLAMLMGNRLVKSLKQNAK